MVPNEAVTTVFADRVKVHGPVPLQPAPFHPVKGLPVDVAVRVIVVPGEKAAVQVGSQEMPVGLEVTSPDPIL